MPDYRAMYKRANKLLERRVRQLQDKGRITLHPSVEDVLNNRDKARDSEAPIADALKYGAPFTRVLGAKETIESTDDPLARRLYELCQNYSTRQRRGLPTHRYIEHVLAEESAAMARIMHEPVF